MTNAPHPQSEPAAQALVIGGGLAGIAAAVRLAQRGLRVSLVETRQRLGGRATSFVDPTTADTLDNCQHVLLGCCTNLLDLYDRLGVADHIEWHRRLYFADAAGRIDVLEADDLPAPAHLSAALLGFRTLSLREKCAIARAMLAIIRMGKAGAMALNDISFADWLRQRGQPRSVMDRFWGVIAISACNESLDRIAARYAIQVFQEGMLNHAQAYVMGLPRVPLVRLYDPAESVLRRAGGQLRLSTSAASFIFDAGRVRGLQLADGHVLTADAYVSAVPFDRLLKLSPEPMRQADPRLQVLDQIAVSPIIGIHLFFEHPDGVGEPLSLPPHIMLMDSPLHWIFFKGVEGRAIHLHGVISAAHALVNQPAEALAALAERETRRTLRLPDTLKLLHSRVVKEKRATFSVSPGIDRLRPGPCGAIGNLYLAGDWCDTGWPATMEGAVRSGYAAAAAVLKARGDANAPGLIDDLPPATLYRLLSR